MVPSRWHVLDDLPRTANGKVDRRALTSLADRRPEEARDAGEAPMDAVEQQIAAIWGELLDVTGIGRDDDFFALGGDSLLVARFVGLLRERVPDVIALQWEVVLRHMLRRPTVAHLASYLREVSRSGPREDDLPTVVRSSPFVALHGPGDDPMTVLVHAGTGTAMPYRALVTEIRRRSAGSASLAALEVPDLQGFWNALPEGLIERMAADYARDMVERGIGRINLVGYCLGGLIATEVARDLTDMGAEVESLTLVSSHSPRFRLDDDILAEYSFSVMMGIPPESLGFPAEQTRVASATDRVLAASPGVIPQGGLAALDRDFADVGAQFGALAETAPERRIEAMCRNVPASAGMYDPEHMNRLLQTFRQSVFAISRYQPEPYLGDVTFLRHSGAYPFPGSKDAVTSQWEEVVLGDLDIIDVAGDHFTCLSRENVPEVVSILERVTGGAVVR
jgi:pyochelin synthetase